MIYEFMAEWRNGGRSKVELCFCVGCGGMKGILYVYIYSEVW